MNVMASITAATDRRRTTKTYSHTHSSKAFFNAPILFKLSSIKIHLGLTQEAPTTVPQTAAMQYASPSIIRVGTATRKTHVGCWQKRNPQINDLKSRKPAERGKNTNPGKVTMAIALKNRLDKKTLKITR